MQFFDAHLDLAWNALEWNRNLELSVAVLREFERQFADISPGDPTVTWADLKRGRVGTVIATVLARLHRKDKRLTFYQSREADYAAGFAHIAYYRALSRRGVIRQLLDSRSLDAHVAEWDAFTAEHPPGPAANDAATPPVGFILSMEGSQPIQNPAEIHEWKAAGLQILGPAHYGENPYCFGTGSEGGLKADGPALLREMRSAGVMLDVTHLADRSFWEALEIYDGPVLASHHNSRALVPGDRQLADEQITALIERGAVIGASFDCWMIVPGWQIGTTDPATVALDDLVNHTDRICQLAGNADHCGIGSDLDGGFGKEQTPHDLDSIADLHKFAQALEKRGYSTGDIEKIASGNWIDFFRRNLAD